MLLNAVYYQQLHKKMLLQSPFKCIFCVNELYQIDYSYGTEVMHVYFQKVNRTYISGILMKRKLIYKL